MFDTLVDHKTFKPVQVDVKEKVYTRDCKRPTQSKTKNMREREIDISRRNTRKFVRKKG